MNSFLSSSGPVAVANGHECYACSHKRNTCDGRKASERARRKHEINI